LIVATTFHPKYNPMIRKIESVFTLADDERHALQTLPMQMVAIKADQDIVREGDAPSRSCLILSGFACAYKMTAQGKLRISRDREQRFHRIVSNDFRGL
jgi:CRP-like cAMP-binding protein